MYVMSIETTTTGNTLKRSSEILRDKVRVPKRLGEFAVRGRAVIDGFANIPMTPIDSTVSTEDEDTSMNLGYSSMGPSVYRLKSKEIINSRMLVNEINPGELFTSIADDYEEDEFDDNRGVVRRKLGSLVGRMNYRIVQAYGLPAKAAELDDRWRNDEKYQVQDDDSRFTRAKKFMGRNALRAAAGTVGGLAATIYATELYSRVRYGIQAFDAPRVVKMGDGEGYDMAANAIAMQPVERSFESYDTALLMAGGAGQGNLNISPEVRMKGYHHGGDVLEVPIQYSAQIGPVVGQERMVDSAAGGTADMVAKYDMLAGTGKPIHLVGYSEGSLVAVDAAWEIANRPENGGKLPDNVKVTLIGSPYAEGGIGDSPAAGLVKPILDGMGIPLDRRLPPGSEVVYFDTDPYANGGNNPTTTLMYDALGLAMGGHAIPDQNVDELRAVYTDSDGVIHKVYSNDKMFVRAVETALNMKINNQEAATAAVNAFFPHVGDPSQPVRPDIRAGLNHAAEALDYQIDPSGNLRIMRDLVANMPDEWKELGQRGFDGLNKIAQTAEDIQTGKVDFMTGASIIMQEISHIFGGVSDMFDADPVKGGTDMGINSIAATLKKHTGVDFGPQMQQFLSAAAYNVQNGTYQSNASLNMNNITAAAQNTVNNIAPQVQNTIKPVTDAVNTTINNPIVAPAIPKIDTTPIQVPVVDTPASPAPEKPPVSKYEAPAVPVIEAPVAAPEQPPVQAPAPVVAIPPPVVEAPQPAPVQPPVNNNPFSSLPNFMSTPPQAPQAPIANAEVHTNVGIDLSKIPTVPTATPSAPATVGGF